MKVEIYQLRDGDPRLFMGSMNSFSQEMCALQDGKINQVDYQMVYKCERDENTTLEDLFYEFNMNHPKDFRGHSLSVSDVVSLDGKLYFCDSFGWKETEWNNG